MSFWNKLSRDQKRVGVVIVLNLFIVIAESAVGVISGSLALLSDAWHNLSDVLALTVTAIALGLGVRPATPTMTYGYVRSEMMATFINAAFLSLLMIWVAAEAVERFTHPVAVDGWLTMMTAGVALVVNTASAFLLGHHEHGHNHHHDHPHEHDANIRAAFWHMASDAVLSLAVVLGGLAMLLWEVMWVDSVLSLIFAVVILTASSRLLVQSFGRLMDKTDPTLLSRYAAIINAHPQVLESHDLHLTLPSSRARYFSAHIVLDKTLTLDAVEEVIETLRHELAHAGATHTLLQPETRKYLQSNDDASHCNGHGRHTHECAV